MRPGPTGPGALGVPGMADTRVIECEGRRWLVQPAAAEPLLADGWPPGRPDRLSEVKRGGRRTVFRFQCAGRTYYLKAYARAGLGRRLRALVGRGKARREWNALRLARAAGLDVPEPVAVSLGADESLVTAAVAGGRRLDEYLFERYFEPVGPEPAYPGARPPELVAVFRRRRQPPPDTIAPRTLAIRLAEMVARLAEARLFLPDLHPGNILIARDGRLWRLWLVDLAEAVYPARPGAVLSHLARLEHFFEPLATPAERVRCHQRVCELLGQWVDPAAVSARTAGYRRGFYRSRDRRTRQESKYFRRVRAGGWRGWATADWAETVERLLAAGDPTAAPAAAPIKQGRTSSVFRIDLEGGRSLIVKRHNVAARRTPGDVRPSRSVAAFRKGHALLARGIATARPAAALDRREGLHLADTLLLTEAVAGGEALSDWLRRGPAPADRRRVTRHLAQMIRRLHDAGFSHRDLKAPNILVAPTAGPDARPLLVDLDGLRRLRRVSAGRRARDLMRLSVSLEEWGVARQTDRLRFLRTYLGRKGCLAPVTIRSRRTGWTGPADNLRRWWHAIERISAAKREALRRKGTGPLTE